MAEDRRFEIVDKDVVGLRLRIGPESETFILRRRLAGKTINQLVGRREPRKFEIEQAREAAKLLINDCIKSPIRLSHLDPIESLFPVFMRGKAGLKSRREIERIFKHYILPAFGARPVVSIKRSEVYALADQVASGKRPTPSMARAIVAQLSSFYTWAMSCIDEIDRNPCVGVPRISKARPRSRILSRSELCHLWSVLDGEGYPWGLAIKLLLLTGQRRGEVFGAEWKEFDLDHGLWTLPEARTKNGRKHLVPLSPQAIELLSNFSGQKRLKLFPSRASEDRCISGFSKAMARMRKSLPPSEDTPFTLHDLRRTCATTMQTLGVRLEVTEAVLNHVSGSRHGIVAVYQTYGFLEEKRAALELWATQLDTIIHGPSLVIDRHFPC